MLHGIHSYKIILTVLTPMYSQCIQLVFSLYTCDSVCTDWTVTAKTQRTRRGLLLFTFSRLSIVFYITIAKNENLINIPINETENKVDWNSYWGKTSTTILTFSIRQLNRQNFKSGVLDEMSTAERWVESSSRPNSSRRGILRSLMNHQGVRWNVHCVVKTVRSL